jgi:hypothetical protein
MDKRRSFLEKKRRGGVETKTTMSASEEPSSRRPRAPGIEENRNTKRCRNWIRTRAGEMVAQRETTMSTGEGPSGGGVNPNHGDEGPRLDPLGFRRGPSSKKEERAGEGATKWVSGLPHVCEHKCLETTKRCRGSGEEGVEDLISDSGNDYDGGEASFSKSQCIFTCSIDRA